MGFYSRFIFPHILERCSAGPETQEQRRLLLASAQGELLEIGFGTGENFSHYPATVPRVIAVDCERMQPRKVLDRIAAAPVPITPIYQDASRGLPFEDDSFETVVTTWTLCSIDNVESAVREIGRVLKPTGSYLFLEHGRSTDPKVMKQQELLAPVVRVVGAGCRMNRQIDQLISEGGLQIVALDPFRMPNTPRILGEMYRGVAKAVKEWNG
jgi:ubiquinone/menaquinone biosynthesis C-methylase UbiE